MLDCQRVHAYGTLRRVFADSVQNADQEYIMARPIWTGTISFGLLQVPVRLMSGERRTDLQFRMLDSRNNARVRYERVNSETGDEVAWKDIVKAFEYEKGNYVVIEEDDFKQAAPESAESVDIESFVDISAIDIRYYEKPYYLVPSKRGEKGYVLLRETLRNAGLAGLARVVIRTREHLALVLAQEQSLLLMMLRYPQELVAEDAYEFPAPGKAGLKISAKELAMAEQLVTSMREEWNPDDYKDDYREKLHKVIEKRLKSKDVVENEDEDEDEIPQGSTTNVVDFMSLLKKSIAENKRQPAKSAGKAAGASKNSKSASKKPASKKKPARKSTKKTATKAPARAQKKTTKRKRSA